MRPHIIRSIIGLFLLGIILLTTGCASSKGGRWTAKEYVAQGIKDRTQIKGAAPQLGLALAGGGTKAGDFSIGVLQGLTEAGIMDQVDAVSTVSGGGYAALWYFARLLDQKNNPDYETNPPARKKFMEKFFLDCLPERYEKYWNPSAPAQPGERCPQKPLTNYIPRDCVHDQTDDKKDDIEKKNDAFFHTDPVRYQNYLRGYQDLFQYTEPVFSYRTTENDQGAVTGDLWKLTLRSLITIPISIFSNAVFDWDLPISTSQDHYESGITRTFGAIPPNCSDSPSPCPPDQRSRPIGNTNWAMPPPESEYGLTFDLLRTEYERGRIPLWIINTTAGEDRAHPLSPQKDFHLTSFELSPYGSGSGLFNYSEDHFKLQPWEAVVASAAFIDSQQKVLGLLRVVVNPLIRLLTLDWSKTIPNPYMPQWKRIPHYILPIPLYSFYGRDGNMPDSFVNIRLSDGGQSENLGAFALVQRNLNDLIISDHGEDQQGTMVDVCRLKQFLANPTDDPAYFDRNKIDQNTPPKKLFVYFPGLSDLDRVCSQNSDLSYDIFQWDHPIVLGCITSDIDDRDCSGQPGSSGYSFRRIYLIKPSLPSPQSDLAFGKTLGHTAKACAAGSDSCLDFFKTQSDLCTQLKAGEPYPNDLINSNEWRFESQPSCELLSFLMMNTFAAGQPKRGAFPQLGTASVTANSSPWIFGAYRELGRHYARQLGWFWGIDAQENTIDQTTRHTRYHNTIMQQLRYPLLPVKTSNLDAKPCNPAMLMHQGHCIPIKAYNPEASTYSSQQQPLMQ